MADYVVCDALMVPCLHVSMCCRMVRRLRTATIEAHPLDPHPPAPLSSCPVPHIVAFPSLSDTAPRTHSVASHSSPTRARQAATCMN